jgi:hypothetical protein
MMALLTAEGETDDDGRFRFTLPGDLSRVPSDVLEDTLRVTRLMLADSEREIARRTRTAPAAVQAPEQAIKIAEVCARLGYKYTYLIRHWPTMGGFKDEAGRVKFPVDVVNRLANGRA